MESHLSSCGASPGPDSPTTSVHYYRSAKKHPQIKIEPNCLVFPPPHFGRCIQNAISIYNVSKQPAIFKMRSQNPERYVAKPHVAVVAPESATRIFVTLRDMNTLGQKNLPEDTHDRFQISLKLYDPSKVDANLAPKQLWSVLQERGARVDHEQDLISHFTKMDTPVGGLVTFFPPTYIPVTPTAVQKNSAAAAGAVNGTARSDFPGVASRTLGSDMNAAARKTLPPPPSSAMKKGTATASGKGASAAGSKEREASKGKQSGHNKMPAIWIGIAVAAMVVVSLAVVVGVTLRGGSRGLESAEATRGGPPPSTAPANAVPSARERLQQAHARLQEEADRLHAAQQAEAARARRAQLEAEEAAQQAQAAAQEAEAARLRAQQEEAERIQAQHAEEARVRHEQQEAEQKAWREAEAEAARLRAQQEEAERARLQHEHEERVRAQQLQREAEEARAAQEEEAARVRAAQEEAQRVHAAQHEAEVRERAVLEEAQRIQAQQEELARAQQREQAEAQEAQHRAETYEYAEVPHTEEPQVEHRTVEPQGEHAEA